MVCAVGSSPDGRQTSDSGSTADKPCGEFTSVLFPYLEDEASNTYHIACIELNELIWKVLEMVLSDAGTRPAQACVPKTVVLFSHWMTELVFSHQCPALCDPVDCSLPGSSVRGVSQARILEWVAVPSPGDLPNPGTQPMSSQWQAGSLPLSLQGSPASNYLSLFP